MKCIGFIGKTNKSEMVQYVAKIISSLGNKVMVIDATTAQRTRYTVPTILGTENQNQYIVQYDSVEIAVGFNNMQELKKYLLSKGEDFNEYDYVLIDTDIEEMIDEYDLKSANNIFFVSSYDKYDVIKGIELLRFICAAKRRADPEGTLLIEKVLYYSEINSADTKYIDRLSDNLPIEWDFTEIGFPYDQNDLSVNIQNQYASKLDLRHLSNSYKAGLVTTAKIITGEQESSLKKVIKNIERNAKFSA